MTERNELARTVRQLPVIAGLEELWQQRPEETTEEYHRFLEWLDQGSEHRKAPPAAFLASAAKHQWTERACAYERAWEITRGLENGKKTPEAQIVDNLTRMVQIEALKILQQSATSPGPVVPLKDLLATIGLIADLQKKSIDAASAKTDLSKFTPAEIRQILASQALLKRAAQ